MPHIAPSGPPPVRYSPIPNNGGTNPRCEGARIADFVFGFDRLTELQWAADPLFLEDERPVFLNHFTVDFDE